MNVLKRIFFGITLLATIAVGASACTPAQAEQLQGILQNIDSVSGTITILTKDGKTVTLDVSTKDAVDDGASSPVYSLEPGNSVVIATDNYGRALEITVQQVEGATPPTTTPPPATKGGIWGTVTGIEGSDITIVDGRNAQVTLTVDSNTVIQFGFLAARVSDGVLSDFKIGDQVNASYDLATMKALKIMVYRSKGATLPTTTPPAATKGGIWGTVTGIEGSSITIIDGRKTELTLLVDTNTVIQLGSTLAAAPSNEEMSDLKVGDQVSASYDLATMKALKIMVYRSKGATPPTVKPPAVTTGGIWGTITGIEGSNITIIDERETELTLLVDSNTVIQLGSTLAAAPSNEEMSDLKVGDQVSASYDPATMKALKITVSRSTSG